jgi:hypothetical protein
MKFAAMNSLADYLALVYHEARNVRHLIRAQAIESEPWKYLIALPVKREEAWQMLRDVRTQVRQAEDAVGALQVFERRFRVSLAQLVALYGNKGWRNAPYGGKRVGGDCEARRHPRGLLADRPRPEVERSLQELRMSRHNTGLVVDKLSNLDRASGAEHGNP